MFFFEKLKKILEVFLLKFKINQKIIDIIIKAKINVMKVYSDLQ